MWIKNKTFFWIIWNKKASNLVVSTFWVSWTEWRVSSSWSIFVETFLNLILILISDLWSPTGSSCLLVQRIRWFYFLLMKVGNTTTAYWYVIRLAHFSTLHSVVRFRVHAHECVSGYVFGWSKIMKLILRYQGTGVFQRENHFSVKKKKIRLR